MKNQNHKGEFNLSEFIWEEEGTKHIRVQWVKEFIKRLLTPNNISKGFVEVSTIKYYAGEELSK